jgi:hypothetical protein
MATILEVPEPLMHVFQLPPHLSKCSCGNKPSALNAEVVKERRCGLLSQQFQIYRNFLALSHRNSALAHQLHKYATCQLLLCCMTNKENYVSDQQVGFPLATHS